MQQLADALNARGIKAARGGEWRAATVWRALRRTEATAAS
jgi:hypothetical protein